MSAYPICLEEIETKTLRKKIRKVSAEQLFPSNYKKIVNNFGEELIRIDGEIPINLDIKKRDRFLFISYDQSILTHGLHKYPAKFFPELPRWLIKRYSKQGDLVLDPFSGSGTSNIEALLANRHSVGLDVDPFSRFISKVKSTPLNEQELEISKKALIKSILDYHPSKILESDIPVFPYRDNWFDKEIILELAYIKKIIESLEANYDIKDFFRVCFSSIIRGTSNADNNCTRTVIRKKLNKQIYPADALKKFAETMLMNIPKMIEFSQLYPSNIDITFPVNMDAKNIQYPANHFDLAVTSPPYVNAVDYPRTHQLELYWLGFLNGSLTPLKKQHVGTESVSSKDYSNLHKINVKEADIIIANIYKKDKRRAYIAYKYLEDIKKNLQEVYRVLKHNGRYIVVVGNNKIREELFENWKYIMELAKQIGFEVETYFGSEIIKHFIKVPRGERINTDWILVLKK